MNRRRREIAWKPKTTKRRGRDLDDFCRAHGGKFSIIRVSKYQITQQHEFWEFMESLKFFWKPLPQKSRTRRRQRLLHIICSTVVSSFIASHFELHKQQTAVIGEPCGYCTHRNTGATKGMLPENVQRLLESYDHSM